MSKTKKKIGVAVLAKGFTQDLEDTIMNADLKVTCAKK